MVTRWTTLQLVFVTFCVVATIAMNVAFPDVFGKPVGFATGLIAIYGLGLGGVHLYLYLFKDDEAVPQSGRLRLLLTIGLAFPLLAAGSLFE